jgi:hypothetical protein
MHLVILDLDETLVHSCDEWIGRSHNFLAADKMIFVRPYAEEFVRPFFAQIFTTTKTQLSWALRLLKNSKFVKIHVSNR